jgi:hypothetical protein
MQISYLSYTLRSPEKEFFNIWIISRAAPAQC